jgi:hypothetical protein
MSSHHLARTFQRKAHGAESVAERVARASRIRASRLRSASKYPFAESPLSTIGRVPLFRALFPLVHQGQLGIAPLLAVFLRVAVASSISLFHHRQQFQRGLLPNKRLESDSRKAARASSYR